MVFQDPTATLNPVFDVGEQIAESLRVHSHERQSLLDYLHLPPFTDRSAWQSHRERAIELMEEVGIADPDDRVDAYPHELSGGMAQRAMLAIALAGDPDVLIADEPTTALDTTTQARILDQLQELARTTDTAIVVITHDMGVVADLCDCVVVMYGGEVIERGPTDRVLDAPQHPYTRGLLSCLLGGVDCERLPTIDGTVPERFDETGCPFASRCQYATDVCEKVDPPTVDAGPGHEVVCGELDTVRSGDAMNNRGMTDGPSHRSRAVAADGASDRTAGNDPVFEARGVSRTFDLSGSTLERLLGERRTLKAVNDVNLAVYPGETVGIVGESGSGKSTLAELLTGLRAPTDGEIRFDGESVGAVEDRSSEQLADVSVVFQTPQASINPRQTAREAIAEPLYEQGWGRSRRHDRVEELLDLVELSERFASRRPHQLSGGQLQRVAIARAIALEPRVVVFDEPASALDVSIRAKLLNLLKELQRRLELTYVVISHNLDVVRYVADRVAVMYLGRIVERGPAELLFDRPSHPYTAALLDAVPTVGGETGTDKLEGPVPSAIDAPDGCAFHPRCPIAEPECTSDEPNFTRVGGADSRCHFANSCANREVNLDRADDRSSPSPNRL